MTFDPKGRLIVSDQYGKLYRSRCRRSAAGGRGDQGRADRRRRSARPTACSGPSIASTWSSTAAGKYRQRALPRPRHRRRRPARQGRAAPQDRRRRRARPARGDPGARRQVALRRRRQRHPAARARRLARARGSGARTTSCPRMVDGSGFMTDEKAPGGFICRVSPDGKNWELVSMGYRNPFDIAFNRDGELFTYDSDMEWDVNTPWYRPTRVCTSSAAPSSATATARASGPTYYHRQPAAGGQRRPRLADGRRRSATARRSRRSTSEALYHLRLELRQALRRAPEAEGLDVHGRARGVRRRHAAAADRHRGQPEGRRDVLRRRRPEHAVGPLPRDL